MYKFLPYMTKDYSVGLFSQDDNDIYHSAFGAITEAYEKFVNPLFSSGFIFKETLNVLDICFGIGYNTKALMSMLNSQSEILSLKNINIDCIDNNKILIELSPFISGNINFLKRLLFKKELYKNIKSYSEVKDILEKKKNHSEKYFIDRKSQIILLKNIINQYGINFLSSDSKKILQTKSNYPFFDKSILNLYTFLSENDRYLYQNQNKSTFVHNIYYKYISKRYKHDTVDDFYNIKFYDYDIREFVKNVSKQYDVVFLDGFTPQKCPCIWSIDMFKCLYSLLNENGIIITYNKSAPVRNALLQTGFYIGNTFDKNNNLVGSIASKNKIFIKNDLSAKQLGILKTRAGIPYRDNMLSLDNKTILYNRKIEFENSNLKSSSQFFKKYNYNNEV